MKIYIETAAETDELMYTMKGFRHDVFAEVDGELYHLLFIERERHLQEMEEDFASQGFHEEEINTIITDSVALQNVVRQCTTLGEASIKLMKPCTRKNGVFLLNLTEAQAAVYREAGWRIGVRKEDLIEIHT